MAPRSIYDYEIIKKIGSGAFGTVYQARRNSDNKLIALKVINIPKGKENLVDISYKEVEYLKKLSDPTCNPFTICYYDSYYNSDSNQFFIEMEYIDGTDMFDFVMRAKSGNYVKLYHYLLLLIAKDLAIGLKYIHSKDLIHNDIKLENIMIDEEYTPRIIDFGLACHTRSKENLGKYCVNTGGTPWYLSPEYFESNIRTPASDMWALGVTLYTAVTGEYPYEVESGDIQELFSKIINTEPPKLNTSNEQINDIVNGLLNKNPNQRYTADDLIRKLEIIPKPAVYPFVPQVTTDSNMLQLESKQTPQKQRYGFLTDSSMLQPESKQTPQKQRYGFLTDSSMLQPESKQTPQKVISRKLTPLEKSAIFTLTMI